VIVYKNIKKIFGFYVCNRHLESYLAIKAAAERDHPNGTQTPRLGVFNKVPQSFLWLAFHVAFLFGDVPPAQHRILGVVKRSRRKRAIEKVGGDLGNQCLLLLSKLGNLFWRRRPAVGVPLALELDTLLVEAGFDLGFEFLVLGLLARNLVQNSEHLLASAFDIVCEDLDLERVAPEFRGPDVRAPDVSEHADTRIHFNEKRVGIVI